MKETNKSELVTAAQIAGQSMDSTFWTEVEQELERLENSEKPRIERRSIREDKISKSGREYWQKKRALQNGVV